MHFKFKLGTDVSKEWLDYSLMNNQFEVIVKGRIDNNSDSINLFIESLLELDCIDSIDQILLVMEHTGLYVNHFVNTWLANGGQLCLVQANKISQALQATNSFDEKTDEMDARRIAEYSVRFEDKLQLFQLQNQNLKKIQLIRSQRKRALKCISILEVPANEIQLFENDKSSSMISEAQHLALKELKILVKKLDASLSQIIKSDPLLKNLFDLICSVPGIGAITAYEILLTTNAFTDFAPNRAKSFAKYCGIVPLDKSSGKMRRKRKTTNKANNKMKTLLTTSAISLINTKSDLGRYYDRKVAEGKERMTAINAMRNKLVLRVFAVVRNGAIYSRNYDLSLV